MSSGRRERGVRALSALQHVFLVVVAILLGASTARAYGYEPACAAAYSSSTDVVKANVLPGTHAFTANNVLYARLDITYYATGTDTSSLFVWGGSGVYSCGAWGAWRGGFLSTHIMFMDVTCNNGGSIRVEFDPYPNAAGRYTPEYPLALNYYDSHTSHTPMP